MVILAVMRTVWNREVKQLSRLKQLTKSKTKIYIQPRI